MKGQELVDRIRSVPLRKGQEVVDQIAANADEANRAVPHLCKGVLEGDAQSERILELIVERMTDATAALKALTEIKGIKTDKLHRALSRLALSVSTHLACEHGCATRNAKDVVCEHGNTKRWKPRGE